MKRYTPEEITRILAMGDTAAADVLTQCFEATGQEYTLLVRLDDGSKLLASYPQTALADTDAFYEGWKEAVPSLLYDVRNRLKAVPLPYGDRSSTERIWL